MSLTNADQKLLDVYMGELAPPKGWDINEARKYRQQLRGQKKGEIARFAPIGDMPFKVDLRTRLNAATGDKKVKLQKLYDDLPPDSFPFIQFDPPPVPLGAAPLNPLTDVELLQNARSIQHYLNNYDPYSSESFEPMVRDDKPWWLDKNKFDKISPDTIRYNANLINSPTSVKDPTIEYLKSRKRSPGSKLNFDLSPQTFESEDYNVDKMITWSNGAIDNNPLMLELHNAIKRHAGDYLLELKAQHEQDKVDIMSLIDYEIRQHMTHGTEGKYVNRWSMKKALSKLSDDDARKLMYKFQLEDATYKYFNPVIDKDYKGYKKWKKYMSMKKKKYWHFMNVLCKEDVTTDPNKTKMEDYVTLNAQAAARRLQIESIRDEKQKRRELRNFLLDMRENKSSSDLDTFLTGYNASFYNSVLDKIELFRRQLDRDNVDAFIRKIQKADQSALNQIISDPKPTKSTLLLMQIQAAINKRRAELGTPPPTPPPLPTGTAPTPPPPAPALPTPTPPAISQDAQQIIDNINAASTFTDISTILNGITNGQVSSDDKTAIQRAAVEKRRELLLQTIQKVDNIDNLQELLQLETDIMNDLQGTPNSTIRSGIQDEIDRKKAELSANTTGPQLTNRTLNCNEDTFEDRLKNIGIELSEVRTIFKQLTLSEIIEIFTAGKNSPSICAADQKELIRQLSGLSDVKKYLKAHETQTREQNAKLYKNMIDLDTDSAISYTRSDSNGLIIIQGDGSKYVVMKHKEGSKLRTNPEIIKRLSNRGKYKHLAYTSLVEAKAQYIIDTKHFFKIDGKLVQLQAPLLYDDKLEDLEIMEYGGDDLAEKDGPTIKDFTTQAKEIIRELNDAQIVHEDLKLDNLVWDGQTVRLIDFGESEVFGSPNDLLKGMRNGIIEIQPYDLLSKGPSFIDQYSMVLALLTYGRSSNTVINDDDTAGPLWEYLFANDGFAETYRYDGASISYDIFKYLYYTFAEEKGDGLDNTLFNSGSLNYNVVEKLGIKLGKLETWIKNHKEMKIEEKNMITEEYFKHLQSGATTPFTGTKYEKEELDVAQVYYNYTAEQIRDIFSIIDINLSSNTSLPATSAVVLQRNTFLDYDSFSDVELDELERELESYEELEVDRMLEGAVTGMGKDDGYDSVSDTSWGPNTYDSESEQSLSYASAYNSESEQSLSYGSNYDSESEQSLSYASAYNSESEQSCTYYNSDSEHSASYDSESDVDR